jgi:hypothetical protein
MKTYALWALILCAVYVSPALAQSLGNAGTIDDVVVDQSGAVVGHATVSLHNPLTGYRQAVTTAADGSFRLVDIPPNQYQLEVTAPAFSPFSKDITVRNSLPIQVKATLGVAGASASVNVEASGADVLEVDPSAHVNADRRNCRRSLPWIREPE